MTFESFGKRGEARKALLEGMIVAVMGVALAFVANAISPNGLKLSLDYYHLHSTPRLVSDGPHKTGPSTNSTRELLEAKLKALGMGLAGSNQVAALFNDTRRLQDLVVFIDARDREHYLQGHIPGAYEFDNYHPDESLGTVWPACQSASQIVVYCNGGECEESRFAAQTLADLPGVAREKLLIYGGGITEWSSNSMPVEAGDRNSGRILPTKP